MSVTKPKKHAFMRVESASFQSVAGESIRPWLPESTVQVIPWSFDGQVYGEAAGSESSSEGLGGGAEGSATETGPTVEELMKTLEATRAELAQERADHERAVAEVKLPYEASARRFHEACASVDHRMTGHVVSLAQLMAEELLAREAALDSEVLVSNLNRALDRVGPVEHLQIEAHEDDVERLRQIAGEEAAQRTGRAVDVMVVAKEGLTPGGMILSFDRGVIDASWGSQLAHLAEAVRLSLDEAHLAQDEPISDSSAPESETSGPPSADADEGEAS